MEQDDLDRNGGIWTMEMEEPPNEDDMNMDHPKNNGKRNGDKQ